MFNGLAAPLQIVGKILGALVDTACKIKDKIANYLKLKIGTRDRSRRRLFYQKYAEGGRAYLEKSFKGFGSWAKGAFDKTKDAVGGAAQATADAAKNAAQATADAAKRAAAATADAAKRAAEATKNAAAAAAQKAKDVASAAGDAVFKFMDSAISAFKSLKQKLVDFFKSPAGQFIIRMIKCIPTIKAGVQNIIAIAKNVNERVARIVAQDYLVIVEIIINLICSWRSFKTAIDYLINGIRKKDDSRFIEFGKFGGALCNTVGNS
jgi:vacuolar-type H+-ATPase subunit E/Vma4